MVNAIICCLKKASASIFLNIEWMQFVLKKCENQHSARVLYDKKIINN